MREIGRGEPAEMLGSETFTLTSVVVAADDHGVESATIEGFHQRPRGVEQDLQREGRVEGFQACEQGRDLRPHHVASDAEPEAAARRRQSGDRPLMRAQKFPRRLDEDLPLRRQPHLARRPLDQTLADPLLQPPQLHADGTLGRAQRLRSPGEAPVLGHQHEGADSIDIQGQHGGEPSRYVVTDIVWHRVVSWSSRRHLDPCLDRRCGRGRSPVDPRCTRPFRRSWKAQGPACPLFELRDRARPSPPCACPP